MPFTSYTFSISGVTIAFRLPWPCEITPAFQPFLTQRQADIRIEVQTSPVLPVFQEPPIHEGVLFQVYQTPQGFVRVFREKQEKSPVYAQSRYDASSHCGTITCLPGNEQAFREISNVFLHIGLEPLMLSFDRLLFHACFVSTEPGGILFSGPSGIGKSTQGNLWTRFRGARVLNGDRPVLSRQADGWHAWGSPYAGSSHVHLNEEQPVRAVVMLCQGSQNTAERLSVQQAFRGLYSATVMNTWDRTYMTRACDLLAQLANEVPVYRLTCTPDERAVQCLEDKLREGG